MRSAIISVSNRFSKTALRRLKGIGRVRVHDAGGRLISSAELKRMAAESSALIAYLTDPIGREIIEAGAGKLKIIANFGAGYNNIDVAAATKRGIWVTNTPGVLHETTADLTWAMLLGIARRIVEADRFTRAGRFHGWEVDMFLGGEVYGKTLGIVGCGEIGQAVARRATGFGMRVLYHQRRRLPVKAERRLNAVFVSLGELLKRSDYVTLHVPLTEETRYMIGKKQLALMKPTAYLLHAGRGKVVDDRALVEALRRKRIAGAALDVYENEPALTPGMTKLDNLLLLPHIGSATTETREKMALLVVDNVLRVLSGKKPITPVNHPVGR